MVADVICVGDRVRVERKDYEGNVESFARGGGGLGGIGGRPAEMVVRTDEGHAHYFDPYDAEVVVTVIQPEFKTGQVWETPDGTHWFIRRTVTRGFCAMPIGSDAACSSQTTFLSKLPKLIFPVGA